MYVKQFVGPFSNGPLNLGLGSRRLVQIGIERPHSIPISEEGTQKIILTINDQAYSIGETDILEFEKLYTNDVSIIVQELTNPYLIIDIAYE